MARQLKVFSWSGFRRDCPPEDDRSGQTIEYVAAHSKAEAARIINSTSPRTEARVSAITETGYPAALERCKARPGVVFWVGVASQFHSDVRWHTAVPPGLVESAAAPTVAPRGVQWSEPRYSIQTAEVGPFTLTAGYESSKAGHYAEIQGLGVKESGLPDMAAARAKAVQMLACILTETLDALRGEGA